MYTIERLDRPLATCGRVGCILTATHVVLAPDSGVHGMGCERDALELADVLNRPVVFEGIRWVEPHDEQAAARMRR